MHDLSSSVGGSSEMFVAEESLGQGCCCPRACLEQPNFLKPGSFRAKLCWLLSCLFPLQSVWEHLQLGRPWSTWREENIPLFPTEGTMSRGAEKPAAQPSAASLHQGCGSCFHRKHSVAVVACFWCHLPPRRAFISCSLSWLQNWAGDGPPNLALVRTPAVVPEASWGVDSAPEVSWFSS